MICAKIEEYRVTKEEAVLEEIKEAARETKKAVAFLFTIDKDRYQEALTEAVKEIMGLNRDETGLFVAEGICQEELLYEVLPVYTLYETQINKKEHYHDLVNQCKEAVKKYPGSKKVFAMLAEVLEYFSEEIFEHYRTIQRLLWEQYVAVAVEPTEEVAYALAKGCFFKAFLLEKYEDDLKEFATKEYPAAYYAVKRLEYRFERN